MILKNIAWTNKDIYRQPDAIGGYAYVMLISYELLGDPVYLEEAKMQFVSTKVSMKILGMRYRVEQWLVLQQHV